MIFVTPQANILSIHGIKMSVLNFKHRIVPKSVEIPLQMQYLPALILDWRPQNQSNLEFSAIGKGQWRGGGGGPLRLENKPRTQVDENESCKFPRRSSDHFLDVLQTMRFGYAMKSGVFRNSRPPRYSEIINKGAYCLGLCNLRSHSAQTSEGLKLSCHQSKVF